MPTNTRPHYASQLSAFHVCVACATFTLGLIACGGADKKVSQSTPSMVMGGSSDSAGGPAAGSKTETAEPSPTDPGQPNNTMDASDAAMMANGDAAQARPVQPTGQRVAYRDLKYTPPSGGDLEISTLDIFRIDDNQLKPLVLLVHGGSWVGGDKAGFEEKIVPWWLEQGYVAVPVNFRLATKRQEMPVVKPADMAKDVAAALAWLMSKADEYKIAQTGVVLMGYSSGAHLVALLGTDERYLRNAGLDEKIVSASISLDVHAYDVPYALELMVDSVVEHNIPAIRHLFGSTSAEQLESSPIHYVDGWAAKTLVISVDENPEEPGTHGYIVSRTAERYVAALTAAGHTATTLHDSTENHSSLVGGFGALDDKATDAIRAFIESL